MMSAKFLAVVVSNLISCIVTLKRKFRKFEYAKKRSVGNQRLIRSETFNWNEF